MLLDSEDYSLAKVSLFKKRNFYWNGFLVVFDFFRLERASSLSHDIISLMLRSFGFWLLPFFDPNYFLPKLLFRESFGSLLFTLYFLCCFCLIAIAFKWRIWSSFGFIWVFALLNLVAKTYCSKSISIDSCSSFFGKRGS